MPRRAFPPGSERSKAPRHRHLALPRWCLVTALAFASLFPAGALLGALSLSVYFEPTDEALYAARVGHSLRAPAVTAMVVLIAAAIGIKWVAPSPSPILTVGVTVTIATMLGLTGLAWIAADRALNPFAPELRAVAAFIPPPGAEYEYDTRRASDHPEIIRSWRMPGSEEEVCGRALESFEAWADPNTVTRFLPPNSDTCYYEGRRGQHEVRLNVIDPSSGPSGTYMNVRARRA